MSSWQAPVSTSHSLPGSKAGGGKMFDAELSLSCHSLHTALLF
jgi:hypothetical protein